MSIRRVVTVLTALIGFLVGPAGAQTDSSLLLKPLPTELFVELDADVTFGSSGDSGNGFGLTTHTYDASGRLRYLFRDSRAVPRFGYDLTYIRLSTDDPALPRDLTDASVAAGMGVFQGAEDSRLEGWIAGLTVGVGHAAAGGNPPGEGPFDFSDANGLYARSTLVVGRTFENGDAFGIVVDYDGNRTFLPDWPLPGFQYRRNYQGPLRRDDPLLLGIGFPVSSLEWYPTGRLTLTANYVIPDNFTARIDYEIFLNTGLFVQLASRREAFAWDAFENPSDRLLLTRRQIETGVRYTFNDVLEQAGVTPGVSFVLAGGYAFGQKIEAGFDSRDTRRLADPSDEPYVRVGLEVRY